MLKEQKLVSEATSAKYEKPQKENNYQNKKK